MVIDFRRQEDNPEVIPVEQKEVERVETFKYLGVVLDNKLTRKNNTSVIIS